ncbi:MAG: methyltransferase domain-containing protein [Coriobacteriia bacterium]|nr:methyltransferase domain-containing protein [Coriobacteriia bacterium]
MRSVHRSILGAALHFSPPPRTLLDVGCGDGLFSRELARCLHNTDITALDHNYPRNLLESARLRFVAGSVDDLPFDANSFDVVTVSLSLHHWADKEKGLAEIYRVLTERGRLIIGDPLLEGWLSKRFWGRLAQAIDGGIFSDPQELTTDLQRVGFEQVCISLVPESMKSLFLITATKP